ncbi:ImmA/IrrE family metallo-endopeptidase [Paenibacillus larvae]
MISYDQLLAEVSIIVDDRAILPEGLKGLYIKTASAEMILLDKYIITITERKCVLVEEVGHEQTTAGDITDLSDLCKRKQELIGRRWGYRKLVPLSAIVQAHKTCLRNRYEIADFLGVTEEFLQETIDYYRDKYGICVQYKQYMIYPLNVT